MSQYGRSGLFTMAEFKNRGVIKLAPDAVVNINGALGSAVIAPVAGKNTEFRDGITTISVTNTVDPPGSSQASFEVTTPIYGEDSNYWIKVDPNNSKLRLPYFTPMMEVKIYMKGRFLVNFRPKYYPVFWGFITNVEENYSGGSWKINVQCADMLHWWAYSQINIHPIPETNEAAGNLQYITAYGTIFDNANPFTIIYSLTKDMGMHQFVTPSWLGQKTPLAQIYPPQTFVEVSQKIMAYWNERWKNIGSLLKMYGVGGDLIIADGPPAVGGKRPKLRVVKADLMSRNATVDPSSRQKSAISQRNVVGFTVDSNFLMNYTPFFDFEKMGAFDSAEYLSKLDIATEIKSRIDYEFFQDVNGQFMFKPPFYNMNVKHIFPYHIKPQDVLSNSYSLESDGIITIMEVQGPMDEQLKNTVFAKTSGFHIDIDLANRYGIRHKKQNIEYLPSNNSNAARSMAVGHMSFINAKATVGTLTIPGRPEMRLGYPVYIEHKDCFYYVKSISHSFDFAGSFSTTLSLEAERRKEYDFKDGKWVGQKDLILKFNPSVEIAALKKIEGKNLTDEDRAYIAGQKEAELLKESGRIGKMPNGRYDKVERLTPEQKAITGTTIPFTDEEGYKVVGAFLYGRDLPIFPTPSSKQAADVPKTETEPEQKTNQRITFMTTGATRESDEMKNMFDLDSQGQINEEGAVPAYNEEFNIDSDISLIKTARELVLMKSRVGGVPANSSKPLTNSVRQGSE